MIVKLPLSGTVPQTTDVATRVVTDRHTDTHTQDKYRNPPVQARQGLKMSQPGVTKLLHKMNGDAWMHNAKYMYQGKESETIVKYYVTPP